MMIEYIIKFFTISLMTYVVCRLLIQYSINYSANRFWLLLSLVFVILIPFLNFNISAGEFVSKINYDKFLETVRSTTESNLSKTAIQDTIELETSFSLILGLFYFLVTTILFFRFIFHLSALEKKKNIAETHAYNGHTIYTLDSEIKPFTYLNSIFISKEDWLNHPSKKEVLNHELYHKKLKHTYDVLFIEALKIIFWFNPILFFYKKLIQANHEYQVDAAVIKSGTNAKLYTHMIIDYSFIPKVKQNSFSSGFSHSLIKNRINMISKFTKNQKSLNQSIVMTVVMTILFLSTAFTIDEKISDNHSGHFYANTLTFSEEDNHIYLKGNKVKVDYKQNNFIGNGSFTFLGKVDYIQMNGESIVPNTTVDILGKKCIIRQITDSSWLSELNLDKRSMAFDVKIVAE